MRSCWQEGQFTLVHRLHVPLALISDAMRRGWQEEQVTLVHRLHVPLALIFGVVRVAATEIQASSHDRDALHTLDAHFRWSQYQKKTNF